MRSARLRHRLIVEEPVAARSATGAESVQWRTFATVWAEIQPEKGAEQQIGGQVIGTGATKVVVRWSPRMAQVAAKWRLRFADRHQPTVYNIMAQPAHANLGQREIHFVCTTGANNG
jgi:SPP1 family predicted phage head-tail adaptor